MLWNLQRPNYERISRGSHVPRVRVVLNVGFSISNGEQLCSALFSSALGRTTLDAQSDVKIGLDALRW